MAGSSSAGFIDIDIVGGQHGVEAMLRNLDSCLSPVGLYKFLYGAVGPYVQKRAADRFKTQGDDATGAWAPLQESTREIRESQGFNGPGPINKRTGELEAYITAGQFGITSVPGGSSLNYPEAPPAGKALKQKVETAQRGRKSPSTVARPVLGLNERDLAYTLASLAFFVQNGGIVR